MQECAERGLAGLKMQAFKNMREASSWRIEYNKCARLGDASLDK